MSRTLPTIFLSLLLGATALAGCFTPASQGSDEPSYQISRSYVMNIDPSREDALERSESPAEFVRTLVDASLVIRVAERGDYSLHYTNEQGNAQTLALTGLEPGAPRTVENVDAFTAATLLRDGETLAARAPIAHDWWDVGDMPLGLRAGAAAEADYDYRSLASFEASLSDIRSEDGAATLDSLVASLSLPATGSLRWTLAQDGAAERLDVTGKFAVDDTRGSLFFAEGVGTVENETVTMGMEVVSGDAAAEAAATFWLTGGAFSAAQFQGASAHANPTVYAWATGVPGDAEEFPCAGKTRADKCQPEQLEGFSESQPAGTREDVPADEFDADGDEDARTMIEFLQKLFAHDLALHDTFKATVSTDSASLGANDGSSWSMRFQHEITVVERERVTIAAGAFDALRIVQTSSLDVDVDELNEENCVAYGDSAGRYGCSEYETKRILAAYGLHETLIRSTLWLEANTFQPLKGDVAAPADIGAMLRSFVDALEPGAWEAAMVDSFDPENLALTATSEASFEARKLAGDTQLSPFVGFTLGSLMTGTLASVASPIFGASGAAPMPPTHYEEMPRPAYPPRHLSLSLEAPVAPDGTVTLVVGSASPDFYWSELTLMLNDEYLSFGFADDCQSHATYEYMACTSDGEPKSFRDVITSGDTIHLAGAEAGDELRVMDAMSNAVIMVMYLR